MTSPLQENLKLPLGEEVDNSLLEIGRVELAQQFDGKAFFFLVCQCRQLLLIYSLPKSLFFLAQKKKTNKKENFQNRQILPNNNNKSEKTFSFIFYLVTNPT